MKKVIVTGGRDYADRETLYRVLDLFDIEAIIQGGASGADALAREWATERSIPLVTIQAEWDKYGKSAGPRRNEKMVTLYPDALVVSFPGGRGTAHCTAYARHNGNLTLEVK